MRFGWAPVLALALAAAPLAPAAAQDTSAPPAEDARALFQRGQAAYSQGDYEGAITFWTRAWELDPRPLLQFNLSQAYERLGRLQDAVDSLQRFIERAEPTDPHQADARARSASLRERIGRTSVRVTGGPEGATILVDGEDRGRTPRPDPIQVPPGSHRIVVRLAGYEDFNSTVVAPAGQTVDVPIEMTGAAPAASGGGDVPVAPIVLFAAAGAAVVAGAILGPIALDQAGQAPARMSPEADTARGLALGADISFGVGLGFAVAGLVVFLVAPGGSSAAPEQRAAVSLWGGPNGGGWSLEVSF
jgi:tetratricopeptide (TPR) repeat protein